MRIALGSERRGYGAKSELCKHLRSLAHEVKDFGCHDGAEVDCPDIAHRVAVAVVRNECEIGILISGSGAGMCMAANKVRGIRAAVVQDEFSGRRTRERHHCNVLCLGADLDGSKHLKKIVDDFLSADMESKGAHAPTLKKLAHIERMSLCESEAQLSAIVETVVDGIISIDEHGAIEWANTAAQRIFGYAAEEIIGQNVKMLMPEPYHSRHDGYLDHFRKTGQRKIIGIGREVVGRRKDGSTFPMDLAVSEVRLGERRVFTGIVRDITEHKQSEELSRAKDVAEAANRAKDRFIAMLSHELRTPLSPALTTAMSMEQDRALSKQTREDAALIRRNIELEVRLIDSLLDLTRIANGKLCLHLEPVDAHALLSVSVATCRADALAKSMEVQLEFHAVRHTFRADAAKLQQVFCNLLNNAIKFSHPNSPITVRTLDDGADSLKIEISDTGIGIPADVLPHIFDAFEQGASGVTRRFGGLGLGLAICKGIVEAHGGAISASSEGRGKGATLSVILPSATAPEAPQRGAHVLAEPRPHSKLKILLVEDHEDSLYAMSRLLRKLEYPVTTATCVNAALEAADADDFDLLISDVALPDGTGLELMKELLVQRPIKGIALTGYGMESDIQRTREAGFQKHLAKPISFDDLETSIREMT